MRLAVTDTQALIWYSSGTRRRLGRLARTVFERAELVREAEGFYAIPDRGDRLIAATAAHLQCPLLTNDPVLARLPTVRTVW